MKIFLLLFIFCVGGNLIGRIYNLSIGHIPTPTPGWYFVGAIEYMFWLIAAAALVAQL